MLIAHATDLSGEDTPAFVHAAGIARAGTARLISVHVEQGGEVTPPDLAWLRAVPRDMLRIRCGEEIGDCVVTALRDLKPSLVVVGTHARHGVGALFHPSIGSLIARNLHVPTLIVPNQGRSFVAADTGAVDLARIVIPCGSVVDARRGIEAAQQLVALVGARAAELELVHAGTNDGELTGFGVAVRRSTRSIEEAIIEAARDACVVVMPTHGHDGIGDVVLGSHTERVSRDAGCPVLSVPM